MNNFVKISFILSTLLSFKIFAHMNPKNAKAEFVITKEMCNQGETIDHSDRFGPKRDQDGTGLCWAYVGVDLVSERLCLEDKKFCQKNLSVLDGARENWNIGEKFEGGFPEDVFSAIDSGGICLEENAPFHESRNWLCGLLLGRKRCLTKKIFKYVNRFYKYYDWYSHPNDLACEEDKTVLNELDRLQKKLNKVHDSIFLTKEEIIFALENSFSNPSSFLKELLITKKCKDHRIKFHKKSYEPKMHYFTTSDDKNNLLTTSNIKKIRMLNKIIKNHSVGIAFCSNHLIGKSKRQHKKISFSNDDDPNCGRHVVTLLGMRWNNKKKSCEVKIRNSWGRGSYLNDFVDAESFLNTSFAINYLSETK